MRWAHPSAVPSRVSVKSTPCHPLSFPADVASFGLYPLDFKPPLLSVMGGWGVDMGFMLILLVGWVLQKEKHRWDHQSFA